MTSMRARPGTGTHRDRFCRDVLEGSGVAFTPGIDFGVHRASQHVRLAYTIDDAKLADGIQRLSRYLGK